MCGVPLEATSFVLHPMVGPDEERQHRATAAWDRGVDRKVSWLIGFFLLLVGVHMVLSVMLLDWDAMGMDMVAMVAAAGWWIAHRRGTAGSAGRYHRATATSCSLFLRDHVDDGIGHAARLRAAKVPGPVPAEYQVEYAQLELRLSDCMTYQQVLSSRMAALERRSPIDDDETAVM